MARAALAAQAYSNAVAKAVRRSAPPAAGTAGPWASVHRAAAFLRPRASVPVCRRALFADEAEKKPPSFLLCMEKADGSSAGFFLLRIGWKQTFPLLFLFTRRSSAQNSAADIASLARAAYSALIRAGRFPLPAPCPRRPHAQPHSRAAQRLPRQRRFYFAAGVSNSSDARAS